MDGSKANSTCSDMDANGMGTEIDVSIIIPVFNGREYIRHTVEAADRIRHSKEIIVVDDGSTDDSYALCREIFSDRADVVLFHKENEGVAQARNYGLSKARGRFCCFVDQDDTVVSETIDRAIDVIVADGSQMLFWATDHLMMDGSRTPCSRIKKEGTLDKAAIDQLLVSALMEEVENPYANTIGRIWGVLFRVSFVLENKLAFRRYVDYEDDYLFIIDAVAAAERISLIKDVGYLWLWNPRSYSSSIRYIPDIISRYEQSFAYARSVLEKRNQGNDLIRRYRLYGYRKTIVGTLKNECSFEHWNRKGIAALKRFYGQSDVRNAFRQAHPQTRLKFDRLLYFLCKYRLIDLACAAVYLYSLKQRKTGQGHA